MSDIQIEPIGGGDHDLAIVGGDWQLVGHTEATWPDYVIQNLRYHLGMWLGESPFDRGAGFPWREGVFGAQMLDGIGALVYAYATETEGVEGLDDAPDLVFDRATGRLFISISLKGDAWPGAVALEVAEQ